MIDTLLLSRCGVRPDLAATVAPALIDACSRYAIIGRLAVAGFIAECMHESMVFSKMEENLNYSATRLMAVWPRRFPTLAIAQQYAGDPQKLANKVYANRNGNGDEASNDGWNFRGSGYLQSTGRGIFMIAKNATGIDYIATPELARKFPEHAALMAGAYWYTNGLTNLMNAAGIDAVSKRINPGEDAVGIAKRHAIFARVFPLTTD